MRIRCKALCAALTTASSAWEGRRPYSRFVRIPKLESFLHVGIGEEREARVALDRAVYDADHVRALHDLGGGNLNLVAEARGVGDSGAVDDAVHVRPQRAGHAHRARLA